MTATLEQAANIADGAASTSCQLEFARRWVVRTTVNALQGAVTCAA